MKKLFLTTATLLTLAAGGYTVLANNMETDQSELENSYEYNRDYGSRFDDEENLSNIQSENSNYRRQEGSDNRYPEHHRYQEGHHRNWDSNDENNPWTNRSRENHHSQEGNHFSNRRNHKRSNGHCGF